MMRRWRTLLRVVGMMRLASSDGLEMALRPGRGYALDDEEGLSNLGKGLGSL